MGGFALVWSRVPCALACWRAVCPAHVRNPIGARPGTLAALRAGCGLRLLYSPDVFVGPEARVRLREGRLGGIGWDVSGMGDR